MNQFAQILQQLHRDTRACLQAVCSGHRDSIAEIEAAAQAGPMQPHLQRLVDVGLVVLQDLSWKPTWSGHGVHNWNQQILWAESTGDTELPELRPGENGDQVVAGCEKYRPLYCTPGYCWCGMIRSDHASEAPETAAHFLAHTRERNRRDALWNRSSGRPILELYGKLFEDQLVALRQVHQKRADGISATELGKALRPRLGQSGQVLSYVDHQVGEKLLERLVELDLVLADEGGTYWYPTFDGAGVANWSDQLLGPAPRPEPRLGENGDWMAPKPCDQYRAFFNAPGYCWCGHPQSEHRT